MTFFFPLSNGSSRVGVYCAASISIEQAIEHEEVDVFTAVKVVRRHRPQLIENIVSINYYPLQLALRLKPFRTQRRCGFYNLALLKASQSIKGKDSLSLSEQNGNSYLSISFVNSTKMSLRIRITKTGK